jgi:gamma-glutamylcyclotransferase (GGCT)/AIG2-like uncharacterized protein YtfP
MTAHIPQIDSNVPHGVFVYGTLMRGFRFHRIAQDAGLIQVEKGLLDEHDLYDLSRGYPAIVSGTGSVKGEFMTFVDLNDALVPLDQLESLGEEYERVCCSVKLVDPFQDERRAWVYRYPSLEAVIAARGTRIPSGRYGSD